MLAASVTNQKKLNNILVSLTLAGFRLLRTCKKVLALYGCKNKTHSHFVKKKKIRMGACPNSTRPINHANPVGAFLIENLREDVQGESEEDQHHGNC